MITILTPTFNRASTLERLYNSLLEQTSKNFEWIIVNDGSFDDSEKIINDFLDKKILDIIYIYQSNQGKPSALNVGVENARGDYIFIVDSDDILTKDSISIIQERIKFHEDRKNIFSGLCFRKGDLTGKPLGDEIKYINYDFIYCNSTEIKNIFKVDLAYCFKRNYMILNKFPKFYNENFVPELYIWNKITDINPVYVYINKLIYLCEYLPDGLTANFKKQLENNPNGFLLYYKDQIFREKNLIIKIKMLLRILQCFFYKFKRECL